MVVSVSFTVFYFMVYFYSIFCTVFLYAGWHAVLNVNNVHVCDSVYGDGDVCLDSLDNKVRLCM
jgi:hypothetical protein